MIENPETILRRSNNKDDKGIFHFQKSLSLPAKAVKSIENIILYKKFEKYLFRSKSTSELSQVTVRPERLNFHKSTQQPSHPPSILVFPQNQSTQSVHIPVTYSPTFILHTPLVHIPTVPTHLVIFPNPPGVMVAKFTPLSLPTQFHDLPQGYSQIIRTYGAEVDITSQQHLDRFNDFVILKRLIMKMQI